MKPISSLLVAVICMVTATTLWAQRKPPGKSWQILGENDSLVIQPLTLNSAKDDYAPIFIDGALYFTSTRKDRHTDEAELQYNENLYVSRYQDSVWSAPRKFYFFNSDDYTALAGHSSQGPSLFIYKTFGEGDLYESTKTEKGTWSVPKKMKAPFNSERHEQSIAQSNVIRMVSSERPGGRGGHDIYWAINDLGTWAEFAPLDRVNTPGDEVDVSLSPDGRIVYFSSNGLDSTGRYHIYFSALDKTGQWTKPEKMPINTDGDDRWFVDADSMFFFASNRHGGTGGDDIYCGKVISLIPPQDTLQVIPKDSIQALVQDSLPTPEDSLKALIANFNEKPKEQTFPDKETEKKFVLVYDVLELMDLQVYKARVQIGAYYYLKTPEEFKYYYGAFDTTKIVVEKVQTPHGTLYKYFLEGEYMTLKDATLSQQQALKQQMDNRNRYKVYNDAFIAVYDQIGQRILIYFNVVSGECKILVGDKAIKF